ncbi:MAG: hypothetical protein KKH44_00390 [Bacteroidetes bacterium]|nr:hypothetical protein [Bacteroidota bacterium]
MEYNVSDLEKFEKNIDIELPKDWNVGIIYGASGSGKTTIAEECFGKENIKDYESFIWQKDKSIMDSFPKNMTTEDIVGLLHQVGFSSIPNYVKPFHVLSNGEKYRVFVARCLAESENEIVVIDEFTSIVDRQIAKIMSLSISKAIKKLNRKIILLSCHKDILDWLNPDWEYDADLDSYQKKTTHDQNLNSQSKKYLANTGIYSKNIII